MRAWLLLFAGCIDIKPFPLTPDGPTTDGARVDGGACVGGTSTGSSLAASIVSLSYAAPTVVGAAALANWSFVFESTANAAPYPKTWMYGSRSLLASATDGCAPASRMGVAVLPGARTDTLASSAVISKTTPVTSAGLVQLDIEMTSSVACYSANVQTTWSFFPDGRITRRDRWSQPNSTGNQPDVCTCPGSHPFTGRVEGAFATSAFDSVLDGIIIQTPMASDIALSNGVCLTGPAGAMATWSDRPLILEQIDSRVPGLAIAAQFMSLDIFDSTIDFSTTTSYQVLPASVACSDAMAALVVPDLVLSFDGQERPAPSSDGYYGTLDDGVDVADTVAITSPAKTAPPGFAIGLHFKMPKSSVEVRRNGTLLVQDEVRTAALADGTHWGVWLRDSFGGPSGTCDTITVSAH